MLAPSTQKHCQVSSRCRAGAEVLSRCWGAEISRRKEGKIRQRMSPDKTTFLPKIFSRNNYMQVMRLIWATNLAYLFSLKLLPGFPPLYPLRVSKKFFFKIYSLKVTSNIKSNTLITNITISKFKYVALENQTIFSYIWILRSKPDFWSSSHMN